MEVKALAEMRPHEPPPHLLFFPTSCTCAPSDSWDDESKRPRHRGGDTKLRRLALSPWSQAQVIPHAWDPHMTLDGYVILNRFTSTAPKNPLSIRVIACGRDVTRIPWR